MAEGVLGNGEDSKFDKQMNVKRKKKLQQLGLIVTVGLMSSDQPLRTTNHILLVFWLCNHLLRMGQPDIEKQEKARNRRRKTYSICIR